MNKSVIAEGYFMTEKDEVFWVSQSGDKVLIAKCLSEEILDGLVSYLNHGLHGICDPDLPVEHFSGLVQ